MKKYINKLSGWFLLLTMTLPLTGCYDDLDDPDTSHFIEQLQVRDTLALPNISIGHLKDSLCGGTDNMRPAEYTFSRNTSNWETRIDSALVVEGVICANDGEFGCLYQSLYLRSIDATTGDDQCIQVAVKNPCLYPLYPVGQRIRLDLKGLYVGVYSKLPKIGFPYYTSSGNHNLGPIPLEMFAQHVQMLGEPDPTCAECQLKDLTGKTGDDWLRATANRNPQNYPTIVTLQGIFTEADSTSVLAPDNLEDAGYGVNRTLKLLTNTTSVLVRTSTGNEVSKIVMPKGDTVQLSGVLMYDSYETKWQITLRDTADFKIIHN